MTRRQRQILTIAPGSPFDPAQLEPWERIALEMIVAATEAVPPLRAPTAEDMQERMGCTISTTVTLIHNLEQFGLIKVERYQRSRRIQNRLTGKWTALPSNTAPHWRTRPRPASMPAPTLHKIRERTPDFANDLLRAARAERMELSEFLAELAWTGWQAREAAIQGQGSEG
jgi:hypothetical protein